MLHVMLREGTEDAGVTTVVIRFTPGLLLPINSSSIYNNKILNNASNIFKHHLMFFAIF